MDERRSAAAEAGSETVANCCYTGKACAILTAINFATSGFGSGASTGNRSAPVEVRYPSRSRASSGKTDPLWGR